MKYTYNNLIQKATLADAQEWKADDEKTIYCVEYFDAFSVDQNGFDAAMEKLEARFGELLDQQPTL